MNKKIITVITLIVIISATLMCVSAEDDIVINGISFNTPDGFIFDENLSKEVADEYDFNISDVGVLVNGDNTINISVINNTNHTTLEELNNVNAPIKTIEEKEGALFTLGDYIVFSYIDGDKVVMIESNSENLINEVIG